VLGGTGELGSEIVKVLVGAGESTTVFARPTSSRERLVGLDVEYVTGDILIEADVRRLFSLSSYRAVIDALAMDDEANTGFYVESQKYISKWAKIYGVQQIILHGAIGAGDSSSLFKPGILPSNRAATIKEKAAAEEILKASGVPFTIMRHLTLLPLTTKESGNARLSLLHNTVGAVSRDGLARLSLECLGNKACLNKTYHAVDDDVQLTGRYSRLWERYARILRAEVLESREVD